MVHQFAAMVADSLCKNELIDKDQKGIYQYGFEIVVSSALNLAIVIVIGIMFHQVFNAVIFYLVFVLTRTYSGGYHASSYTKCNLLFTLIFLLTLLMAKLMHGAITFPYILMFLMIYIGSILEYAPIENKNKKLSEEDKVRLRKKSIGISALWTIIVCVLYFMNREYALIISITLVMIAMLMIIEINIRMEIIE